MQKQSEANRDRPRPVAAAGPLVQEDDPALIRYGFDFGLWMRRIVRDLIRERFGIGVSITTVGTILAERNLTPQKLPQRAYQRSPEAIARW